MELELVHLCDVDVTLLDPTVVGEGPLGTRLVYEVEAGRATGERLSGELVGHANGDWLTVVGTVATLDVRVTIRTDDGALILCTYRGRSDLAAGPGASPIHVAPLFETGDERYAWLNAVQAVGVGRLDGTRLAYTWYEVR